VVTGETCWRRESDAIKVKGRGEIVLEAIVARERVFRPRTEEESLPVSKNESPFFFFAKGKFEKIHANAFLKR
jgi:hypothetical protein